MNRAAGFPEDGAGWQQQVPGPRTAGHTEAWAGRGQRFWARGRPRSGVKCETPNLQVLFTLPSGSRPSRAFSKDRPPRHISTPLPLQGLVVTGPAGQSPSQLQGQEWPGHPGAFSNGSVTFLSPGSGSASSGGGGVIAENAFANRLEFKSGGALQASLAA